MCGSNSVSLVDFGSEAGCNEDCSADERATKGCAGEPKPIGCGSSGAMTSEFD